MSFYCSVLNVGEDMVVNGSFSINMRHIFFFAFLVIQKVVSLQIYKPTSLRLSRGFLNNPYSRCTLYAKKKTSKLISDDLFTILDENENEAESVTDSVKEEVKLKPKKANKSATKEDASPDKKHQVAEPILKSSNEIIANPDVEVDSTVDNSKEKLRKDKPPSRIRFAENAQPDFVMMALERISVIFGNEVVMKNATLSVTSGERLGLVGPNGGGKTTLLRVFSGELEPSDGEIVKSNRNLRVSFLRQEFIDELVQTRTLREELKASFKEELGILLDISKKEEEIATVTHDPEEMERVLNALQLLQEQAMMKGAYVLDSKIDKIMDSMGFSSADQHALVSTFSGGWRMRIGLAKILLQEPNILLLDEPTNHLGIVLILCGGMSKAI